MKKYILSFALLLFLITQTKAQKPVADFSASSDTICADDCISFTDASTNNPTSWLWTFSGSSTGTSSEQNPQSICYIDSGSSNIKLIVSNSSGSDSVTKTIFVYPVPTIPLIWQNGDTLFYHADPSYVYHQWYYDSTAIAGATDSFLVITQYGDYSVLVVDKNCCWVAVGIDIVHNMAFASNNLSRYFLYIPPCDSIKSVGIQNHSSYNILSLAPNPATNQLTIHTSSFHASEAVTVSIMNVLGQEAAHPPTPSLREGEDALIDVSKLAAGMYFIQLKTESGSVVKRFVKE